jgi:hypothetical protein
MSFSPHLRGVAPIPFRSVSVLPLQIVAFCLGSRFDQRKNACQLLGISFPGGLAEQLTPHCYVGFIEHYGGSDLARKSKSDVLRSG